jgi:hypothetical protein
MDIITKMKLATYNFVIDNPSNIKYKMMLSKIYSAAVLGIDA